MPVVAKTFKTTTRKFKEKDKVTEADVENFSMWEGRGFIRDDDPVAISTIAPSATLAVKPNAEEMPLDIGGAAARPR